MAEAKVGPTCGKRDSSVGSTRRQPSLLIDASLNSKAMPRMWDILMASLELECFRRFGETVVWTLIFRKQKRRCQQTEKLVFE